MASGTSITTDDKGINIRRWPRTTRIGFDQIRRIVGEKLDKLTYEENFLLLDLDDGRRISLGELDSGFAESESALRTFASLDPNWRAELESAPAGTPRLLWEKPSEAAPSAP